MLAIRYAHKQNKQLDKPKKQKKHQPTNAEIEDEEPTNILQLPASDFEEEEQRIGREIFGPPTGTP